MNDFFSFKRYAWLVKRQWFENAAIYKWGIVLMALSVGLLFWLVSEWKTDANPRLEQVTVFFITLVLFLYSYGAWFFESLCSNHKRMFYFSLPVTSLERVAVAFLFVIVLMPILILLVFSLFDFFAVQLFNHIHGTSVQIFFTKPPFATKRLMIAALLTYLSNASFFTLFTLMFGKKGLVLSILCFIGFFLILGWLSQTFFAGFTFMDFIESGFYSFFLPICWVAMYFVMKKKEA